MKELTIGEVAKYAGLQTSAIRYYERQGLLPPPKRVNGQRRYDGSVLKRLGLIQLVRQAGFGIRELKVLFSDLDSNTASQPPWQSLVVEKIAELDAMIKRTQATKSWLVEALQSECNGVDECVTITFDESGNRAQATLTCRVPRASNASQIKTMKLLTMPLP